MADPMGEHDDGVPEKRPKLRISVIKGKDTTFKVKVTPHQTMFDLKTKLERLTNVPVQQQYLTCLRRQKLLDAENKFQLSEFGIEDGDSLYLSVGGRVWD